VGASLPVVATGLLSVAAFMAAFLAVRIVPAAAAAIATAHGAVAAMRDPSLDDLARERAAQRASLRLFGAFGGILLRSALALAAAFLPVLAADASGIAPEAAVTGFLMRWDVIVVLTVLVTAGWLLAWRAWPSR
jgi:hypothetical protein